jgi:AAA domain, putative AbiEii toxin, Type IV TA system
MSHLIAKVSLSDLESFLSKQGEIWDLVYNDNRGLQNEIPHGVARAYLHQLIRAFPLISQDKEHLVLLRTEMTSGEAVQAFREANSGELPTVREGEIIEFIENKHVHWLRPCLFVALGVEDAANGYYMRLMPEEEEELPEQPKPFSLDAIALRNFKGIGDRRVRIEIKPITVLFGQNSAGKSTMIHALHYAREILERRNLDADKTIAGGQFVDLGGFRNIVHDRVTSKSIWLEFEMTLNVEQLPSFPSPSTTTFSHGDSPEFAASISKARVSLEIAWGDLRQDLYVKEYAVEINNIPLARIECQSDGRNIFLSDMNYRHPVLPSLEIIETLADLADEERLVKERPERLFLTLWPVENQYDALPNWGQVLPLQRQDVPFSVTSNLDDRSDEFDESLDQVIRLFSQMIVGPGELLRDYLSSFRYLGPIREVPPRGYAPPRTPDSSRWASGIAAWDLLAHGSDRLISTVSDWMANSEKLNTKYRVARRHYKRLDLSNPLLLSLASGRAFDEVEKASIAMDKLPNETQVVLVSEKDLDLSPMDVGIGISQVLPVVVAAADGREMLLMIEQPELHLHPALQARLGDLIIHSAIDQRNSFLVETHSEHLILRFLRRIRETTAGKNMSTPSLRPEDISLIYVGTEEGESQFLSLRVEKRGRLIDSCPGGFFEEEFEELF